MRISFTADEGKLDANEDTLTCGVSGDGKWLVFQRDAEDSDEDWGIHLEYTDQSNGDYECVAACRLGPDLLSVDLSRQLGQLKSITGFDVALRISPEEYANVRSGLRRVFRGHLDMLADAAPGTSPGANGH